MHKKSVQEVIDGCKNSSFNKSNYSVNLELKRFVQGMLLYVEYDLFEEHIEISSNEFLKLAVPAFQRKNDKWNESMKQKFIENLLSGVSTTIMMFRMFGSENNSQIIDGLQRTTAILEFLDGKIKPFGYSIHEIGIKNIRKFRLHLMVQIYDFESWAEVGKFYVDMNENITHSKTDIQKAKDWFLENHGVKL